LQLIGFSHPELDTNKHLPWNAIILQNVVIDLLNTAMANHPNPMKVQSIISNTWETRRILLAPDVNQFKPLTLNFS
jgi:hypothetical protein